MVTLNWLDGVRLGLPQIRRRRSITRVEALEPRMVLATDFGDAPDTAAGSGSGNYETLLANNGPRHTIVAGLFLGARVDGEADGTPNAKANGDDIGTDDEDGVVNPEADLRATAGTQPTIALRATNTTGTAATLSGWIDSNGDGVFDNATERAQLAVPTGTNNGLFTLTLPTIPAGFFGKTYARFRLSTDAAGGSATGLASDGEVEDYVAVVENPSVGFVKANGLAKIAKSTPGLPAINDFFNFGSAVVPIGDLDGDGVSDIAVGAYTDNSAGGRRGAVNILFLNADGTIKSATRIAHQLNGGPTFGEAGKLGVSLANIGDLDGDGVVDLAAGAVGEGSEFSYSGAVYILFLNTNGTVKTSTKIGHRLNGGPTLATIHRFGQSVTALGDLDGDGLTDIAVGASGDITPFGDDGSVHVLFLNADGTAKSAVRSGSKDLADTVKFGSAVANLGDIDGDGVSDLAIGANETYTGGIGRGGVQIAFLRSNGTIKSTRMIANGVGGGPILANFDFFGTSVANLGDLNGDGIVDLGVGAPGDDTGGTTRGAVHILLLDSTGAAKSSLKLANGLNGGLSLTNQSGFGTSVTSIGDVDGDGVIDLAVGATGDSDLTGALYVLRLQEFTNSAPTGLSLDDTAVAENLPLGSTVGSFATIDPDVSDAFTYTLVTGEGSTDNERFSIVGNQLLTNRVFDFEGVNTYSIRVRSADQRNLTFERSFVISVINTNDAPVLDNTGNPFIVLGVGSRQSEEMLDGVLVSEILARAAQGNPISDQDASPLRGIAITSNEVQFGTYQYTLATVSPQESDWKAIGGFHDTNARLLPATARIRFVTARQPHHAAGTPFIPLGSFHETGLTFRAWDQTSGTPGGLADSSRNGGATAFSTAVETVKVYFEARLFRSFNTNAGLNIYSLEAEFNALTGNPAIVDRSTSAFTGFTVLLSDVPELGTVPVFRMYFGVQFNDDGTETDMGYRYLTTNAAEADFLEGLGRVELRSRRQGAYFREIGDPANPGDTGVNNRTAILGYIHTTQQPGTAELTQIYRTDRVGKPTRPGGTVEGSTPTSTKSQEQGDHVYTTNTAFETGKPGTWRVERSRGFVRELTPNPTAGPPTAVAPVASVVSGAAVSATLPVVAEAVVIVGADEKTSRTDGVARLIAVSRGVMAAPLAVAPPEANPCSSGAVAGNDEPEKELTFALDEVFTDTHLVANLGFGS